MTDETPTHRHVMEKARAEIERLTRELADRTEERDTEADAVTQQRETIKRLTRELAEARRLSERLRMEADRSDDWRDEAISERDARPAFDANDCAALLCVLTEDTVQPDLGWFGRIVDELHACRKRSGR